MFGCSRDQPNIIVITATFPPMSNVSAPVETALPPAMDAVSPTVLPPQASPTPDPTRPAAAEGTAQQYVVQAGDTLFAIAEANGISLESLLSVNQLIDPNILSVGQVLNLPAPPNEETSSFKIIPDSRLVRGPGSGLFDVTRFINQQSGYIQAAMDMVDDKLLTAAVVVERVAREYSVDPRLLLALLEYRAGWLSQTTLSDTQMLYPLEQEASPPGFDRKGLYRQLAWTANQLNIGYYGWRYRGIENIEFEDGTRQRYGAGLNAGTIAVQYFLSQNNAFSDWISDIGPQGFYQTYTTYFGNPFAGAVEPLIPPALEQPIMVLPFAQGQTWFFTGGPHGGWGSGSAWAAIDFAPPDELPDGSDPCYVSAYSTTAVTTGVIVRSDSGNVILDLDGDGDETTGWTVFYLHLATEGRVPVGTVVQPGDPIGYPSCEGGFSNGTHLHLARRYNGEWLPVSCDECAPGLTIPPFVLGGWTMYGYPNQEYQGYMSNGAEQRVAEQGRLIVDNRVSW
ncbi:MAG TPA: LysM peptidoglycan-binding domain-containing protein [Phototrophicaceae bacterium]|nr:LysM peptidoglycan-binding domain-containing protein [Phototrophicaceae bacterium]